MTTDTGAATAPIGTPSRSRHRRLVPHRSAVPYLLLGLLFLAAYATVEIIRYAHYSSMSWDLAIFVQETQQYAHLHAPVVTIKGPTYNILGDHFSPILALLAPLYRLFPTPVTLLIAQSALFASSVTIVAATAARFTTRAKGLSAGFAYGLSWGLQRAVDFDFHEICFAVPMIAMVLRSILLQRWYRAAFWALPLVLVKEDMGLTVAAVGIVLALLRQYLVGAVLTVFGIGMLFLTVDGVIPHFNPHGQYDYLSKLPGGSPMHALTGSPLTLLHTLVSPDLKLQTLGYLLATTAFLALRSPLALVALPTLLWRFTSSNDAYWGMDWHYNAVLMPILFLALVDGIRRAEARGPSALRSYAAHAAVPAATAVSVVLCVTMSLPLLTVLMPSTYSRNEARVAMLRRAEATIPNGVTVESNVTLMAHLASRTTVYWVGVDTTAPQYVALDLSYGWSSPPSDVAAYAQSLHPGSTYRLVFNDQQFEVAQRVG